MGVLDFLLLPAIPYVNKAPIRNWLLNIEPPDVEELPPHFEDPNYYDQEPPPEPPADIPEEQRLVPVHLPEVMTTYDYSNYNVSYARWVDPYEKAVIEEPSYIDTSDVLVTELESTPYTTNHGPVQHASPPTPDIDEYLAEFSGSEEGDGDGMRSINHHCSSNIY
jgi:hypothetical protein